MTTITDVLDLVVGQRTASFRFDLMQGDDVLGQVHPLTDSVPVIENNINRTIKRTLSNLKIAPDEEVDINTLSYGIMPWMVFPTLAEYSLGYFLFGDGSRVRHSYGLDLSASMVDRTYILDQAVETSIGYDTSTSVGTALNDQFLAAGIEHFTVEPITTSFGTPVAWPAGTSRYKIMTDLASMGGCNSPFFDNQGFGQVMRTVDLSTAPVDHVYVSGRNITSESIVETDDMLSSPNRYIVIDNSNTTTPIVGYYDIPDAAPYSRVNRGFVVATVTNAQGLESITAANDYAQSLASQDTASYRWVTFSGPLDPRHDTFEIVEFLGNRYREQSWRMPLKDGADMAHELRRVYS